MSNDNDPMMRPDGHRYEAPESREDERSKSLDYLVLGVLVGGLMLLVATGVVPIFDF